MGRPRKSAIIENVAPTEQKTSKSLIEDLEREVKELTDLATAAIEGQIEARQIANEAEDKFRELASETEMSLNRMRYHCEQVQKSTGSLTLEDVDYCINLTKRIIEHKFKKA